ncbi:MAG: hypothetical protein M0Q42_07250 [Xanthomonadales bacterium]|nr:hypothetical protein [Xanthomonadales bacterium]
MYKPLAALLLAALMASLLPATASAQVTRFTPESGWWWNPAEDGVGYNIEIQDDFIFLAAYTYMASGSPRRATWFTASGQMQDQVTFQTNEVWTAQNGTCPTCSTFTPPQLVTPAAALRPLRVDFHTETTAILTWGGQEIDIERFDFRLSQDLDIDPKTELWLGEWQIVMDWSPRGGDYVDFPFMGEVLVFDELTYDSVGDYYEGCRPQDSTAGWCDSFALQHHPAYGFYNAPDDTNIIVVQENPDTVLVFETLVGTYQFDGYMKICPINASIFAGCLDNSSYPVMMARGWRSASRAYVQGDDHAPSGVAPTTPVSKAAAAKSRRVEPVMLPAGAQKAAPRPRADAAASEARAQAAMARQRQTR